MRAFAMTGIVTEALISSIIVGLDMRATPPADRMSAGTRSSAMTAAAPTSSAIFACSALTTSMMTPPLSISARPALTLKVPVSTASMVPSGRALPMYYKARVRDRSGSRPSGGVAREQPRTRSPTRPSMRRNSEIWRRMDASDSITRSCGSTPIRGGVLVIGGAGVPRHSGAPAAPHPAGRSGPMSQITSDASPS